jgi:hypothetical protein
MLNASTLFRNDILDLEKEALLRTLRFSYNYDAFIFNSDNRLTHILVKKRNKNNFNKNFGNLVSIPGTQMYEKKPDNYENNTVFISKYFGFKHLNKNNEQRGINIRTHCFIKVDSMTILQSSNMSAFCEMIPKCLGYIEDYCLVSYTALSEPIQYNSGSIDQYYEKRRTHRVFDTMIAEWDIVLACSVILLLGILIFPDAGSLGAIWNAKIDLQWVLDPKFDRSNYEVLKDQEISTSTEIYNF